jgi:hypothetical protein
MRKVYGNAFITLSAAGAQNCQGGMFFPRSPKRRAPFRFLAHNMDGGGHIYFDLPFSRFSLSDEEPIDKRAWTLQERLLSPRLVKYGTHAISWECRTATLSEFDATVKTESQKFYRTPRLLTIDHWMRVIEDYSSRSITFSEDRRQAILGIVQQFQECLKMRYVAGLWESAFDHAVLLRLLIWEVVIDTVEQWEAVQRLPGPTWTWTSVNTPVSWRYPPIASGIGTSLGHDIGREFLRWHAEIIACQVTKEESSPFGQVKHGQITLRGVLKQIKALAVGLPVNQLYILDPPENPGAKRGVVKFDLIQDSYFTFTDGKYSPNHMVHGEGNIALPSCLYLADVKMKDIFGNIAPCGLLVTPDSRNPKQWRKVGVFSLWDCEVYTELESGWLDDGVRVEIELI